MGEIDDMLQAQSSKLQETNSHFEGNTLLRKVSKVYMIVGVILIAISVIFIVEFFDCYSSEKKIAMAILGFSNIGFGLFCLFAGAVGQAIDDIRNNLKK